MDVSPKLIVEVVADVSQFVKSMSTSTKAATAFQADLKAVSVDARAAANAQVAAAVKTTDALHAEVAAYHEIAAAASAGSKEQIAAARLGASAQRRLDGALVDATGSTRRAHGESQKLGRELEHVTRGAISGTGAVHGFGRSLAFASGGFVAFEGVSRFLTDSINAAREAGVAQRSLAAQMKASGESFATNREQVEKVALSYAKFGFNNDEVVQSLTVLERGTGNLNKAIAVQGLTADIARAKNIDLASAATIVAKVFGGQETALRRAVPGLAKHAHGWDLIRLAQAKMAGQAAAGTTTTEQFNATLYNTEVIVGRVLLPTLNTYLVSLSNWLQRMNESGKLQKDVAGAVKLLNDAIAVTKAVLGPVVTLFKALSGAVGSTKTALEVLAGVWAATKLVGAATALEADAVAIGAIGAAAEGSAVGVGALGAAITEVQLAMLGPAGLIAAAGVAFLYMQQKAQEAAEGVQKAVAAPLITGSPLETILVPKLAKQIAALKAAGKTSGQIITQLRKQLGGSLKADDLIAEAFSFGSGSDPALQARIRKQVAARAPGITKTATDELKRHRATPAQRNTWFDAIINRQLSRVSDAPLEAQLPMLQRISATITKRIAITKDITRKLNLEDQLYAVGQQEKQVREQQQQAFFDRLQLNVDMTSLTKTVNDDLAALAVQQAGIEKRIRIQGHTLALDQAWLANQQAIAAKHEEVAAAATAAREAAKQAREAAQAETLAWADFAEERAAATPGLKDDLKTARDKLKILIAQAGAGKRTAEEARTIWEQEQKINTLLNKGKSLTGTKFRPVNAENFVRSLGLGLNARQAGRLTAGIAQFGPGGTMPVQRTQSFALAGGVTIQGDLHLHGVQDPKQLQNALTKHAKSQPHPRRGAR